MFTPSKYFIREAKSIQIFQLIGFGITFRRWTARCVFVFFTLYALEMRSRCEAKPRAEGEGEEKDKTEWVSEWVRKEKQLLCAEKQTSFLSSFVVFVTTECQGQSAFMLPRQLPVHHGIYVLRPLARLKRFAVYRNPKLNTKNTRQTNISWLRLTHRGISKERKVEGGSYIFQDSRWNFIGWTFPFVFSLPYHVQLSENFT